MEHVGRTWLWVVVASLSAWLLTSESAAAQLANPDFNDNPGTVATGWQSYAVSGSPAFVAETGVWQRTAGGASQRFWADGNQYDAGVYQQVAVTAGHRYRFCVFMHHYAAGDSPGGTTVRAGIDGAGGTNPNAASWGASSSTGADWVEVCNEADATAGTITVFARAMAGGASPGERSSFADDARLEDLGGSTTPTTDAGTTTPTTDAGTSTTPGTDAGTSTTPGTDAGTTTPPVRPTVADSGGCAVIQTATATRTSLPWLVGLLALWPLVGRRRKRR